MVVLILWLSLSSVGKEYATLIAVLVCCTIAALSAFYLDPIFSFLQDLKSMIPVDHDLLQILLKAVGIGFVGEISAMVCADSGNSALGKSIQLLTNVLIIWLSLPLFQTLLAIFKEILEDI